MPTTVADLVQRSEFQLKCVAAHSKLSNQVGWVHVSEVHDPTPWLRGGEFLINSMLETREGAELEHYFERVVNAGISALGCGVGVTRDTVPETWRVLAEQHQIPLIEIPLDTPYIAISQHVVSRQSEDRHKQFELTLTMQAELASAIAADEGLLHITRMVSRMISGWAAVIAGNGDELASSGDFASDHVKAFSADLDRFRRLGGFSSVSAFQGGAEASIFALGTGVTRRLLIAGTESRLDPHERVIVSTAASLLSLATSRNARISHAERTLRNSMLRSGQSVELLEAYGFSNPQDIEIAIITPADGLTDSDLDSIEEAFTLPQIRCMTARVDHQQVALIAQHPQGKPVDWSALGVPGPGRHAGLQRFSKREGIQRALEQAQVAAEQAVLLKTPVFSYEELSALGQLRMSAQDAAARVFRDYVARLPGSKGQLALVSLKTFLTHNGNLAVAANELGIHRQTLRARLDTAESALEISLDSPDDRAAVWLALSAHTELAHE